MDFLWYLFGFFSIVLRLLLKGSEGTTKHQKWPKISENSIKINFSLQEGLYLLVRIIMKIRPAFQIVYCPSIVHHTQQWVQSCIE